LTGFQIAGPNASKVLATVTRSDTENVQFLDVRWMVIGMIDCLVQRISYTGDLGYEIYCKPTEQRQLWQSLWKEGQPYGMKPFGMRAMMSLRLDKFFGSWMSEFSPDYTAGETGLDRFIAWSKPDAFIGREAALAERENGSKRKLVAFEVETEDADVVAYEPVWINGRVEGFCTSGGFSHFAQKSIALALIPRDLAQSGLSVEIEILGEMRKAHLLDQPLLQDHRARAIG
jgi:dimethylglycine dehydrogenase